MNNLLSLDWFFSFGSRVELSEDVVPSNRI
jgi:hypothetical protein